MTRPSLESALHPIYHSLIPDLERGISRDDLQRRIGEILGQPMDSAVVETARMNLVGGLRSWGFIVQGGRGGGKIYTIVGWEARVERPTSDTWTGPPRTVLDDIGQLPRITSDDRDRIREFLARRPSQEQYHENSWLYPRAYELARDTGWWFQSPVNPSHAAIIMRRFVSYPRFRIFNLTLSASELLELAEYLSRASCRPVYIVNPGDHAMADLKLLHSRGSWGNRRQALYRTDDIANRIELFLNRRGRETLRSQAREMAYHDSPSRDDQKAIVTEWRRINEPKHRQLAITRDFVAIDDDFPQTITFVGYRQSTPACLHILEPLANRPDTVAQIVEKSLNYRTQVGGRPGTADWNLYQTSVDLLQRGIQFINAGGFDGGGAGLAPHKRRFARDGDDIVSRSFYTDFPIHPLFRKEPS